MNLDLKLKVYFEKRMEKLFYIFVLTGTVVPLLSSQVVTKPEVPDVTNGLDSNGTHVCNYIETISKKVKVQYEQTTLTTVYYSTCCNFLCFYQCNRTRLVTKKVISYRLQTKYFDRKNYHCCSGWKRNSNQDTSCKIPKCQVKCQNGGTCVSPDTCTCAKGFTGKYCSLDVNECNDARINDCEQHCIDMIGGFRCGCKRGYTLDANKKTCSDINECAHPNKKCSCRHQDGVCHAQCSNTPGSFACTCQTGYFLNSARQCEDINECLTNIKPCDQQCINTPGSFTCGCAQGYKHNGIKCVDINECLINNGGCSDTCTNVNGSYACTCPDGFYLDKDGKTCKVIQPSMKNSITCASDGLGFLECEDYTKKLVIVDAMYGRLTTKHCQTGNYTQNVRCKAQNPAQHLLSCNGKSSCVFIIDKQTFGDPCPGIEKYMQVIYDCTD